MKQRVLITGGTGLTGRYLIPLLEKKGHEVSVLSRSGKGAGQFYWNPASGEIDMQALKCADVIIHLAGASIAGGRWTKKYKKAILDSRIHSTRLLYESLKKGESGVTTFVSSSAVGIYGDSGDRWVDETSPPGDDFLSDTCRQWEAEIQKIADLGIRVVVLRTGLVLANEGGLLPVIARPLKWGFGTILGSGNQFMSWIHINDLCRIYLEAMESRSIHGIYNAVAPNPVTHREFMLNLSRVFRRPLWLPDAPAAVLKLFLGEKAALVLSGQRVSSKKIRDAGFTFEFPDLEKALQDLKNRG